jgi:hypothetical protein
MKKLLLVLLTTMTILSCSKEEQTENVQESTLIAHFNFDGNLLDHSSTGAHGFTNQQPSSDRFGTPNSSLKFSNGYFRSGNIPFNLRGQYTFSMWMKMNAYDEGQAVMELTENRQCNSNPQFWIHQNNLYLATSSQSQNRMRIPQTPSCNGWTHILYTVNETITKLYINGVLVETKSLNWPSTQNIELTLGNAGNSCFVRPMVQNPYKQPSRVMIDEVRIYSGILSQSEITLLSSCEPPKSNVK